MQRPWTASLVVPAQERRTASDVPAPLDAVALLAAAEHEADALAGRLHDGALQALVVARYAADAAVRGADAALARDAVQDALVALRRAVWLVRPRGSDGLAAALAELSAQRVAAGATALELSVDEDAADALAPAARAAAYRFVQAAADVPGVVAVARDGADVTVSVPGGVDDLPGWTARARALGGHLRADGATTRLVLPVPDSIPEGDR